MGASNLEARIKRLENANANEFGTPTDSILFPVRKLMLAEERSHDESGTSFSVLVATWDKPAGVLLPDSIRLVHNDTIVSLQGNSTSYRMNGYEVGTNVVVKVTAIYSSGNASTIIAEKTITGDVEPPSIPTNLVVTGGFRTLTLKWENPTAEDFSHVEIWESVTDGNLATSERIAQAYGTEFVRSNCGVLETRWYWIRALDVHGNFSDFTGAASGTTTAIAMEDIPENTITKSMLIDTLSTQINDATSGVITLTETTGAHTTAIGTLNEIVGGHTSEISTITQTVDGHTTQINTINQTTAAQGESIAQTQAAIQIVEDVRTGEVNVFRQASAPTEGMVIGDIWVDNSESVYRYEGGTWVSKAGSTVYDLLKTAIAQYVVKVQTAVDGKLKLAGFGLYNDATTGSEFAILADRFYVYTENANGYSNIQVFTVDSTTNPPTVGINGNLIVDGSITGEKINAAAKIQLGDGGQLITGEDSIIQMASGVFALDSTTGIMIIHDPNDLTTGDFIKIEVGDITSYKYLDGAYRSMKSLRKMEVGSGTNGSTITLPGNWPSKPKIQVSPNALQSYNKNYPSQNQELVTYADEVTYNNTTGVVTFIPRAYLQIAASSNLVYLPVAVKDVGFSYRHDPQQAIPGTFITSTYSTVPSGATNIIIKAKIYAQNMIAAVSGSSNYVTFRAIKMTITAYVGGSSYVVGSVTFPPMNYNISSEPINYYVEVTKTISSGSGNVYLSAYVESPSGYTEKNFSTGSWLECSKGWLRFDSIQWSLSSATQLATGTLNYIAIAE